MLKSVFCHRRHDPQHNVIEPSNTQYNDIQYKTFNIKHSAQHNNKKCDARHKQHSAFTVTTLFFILSVVMLSFVMLSIVIECYYAECH
jgi:hypothetical protein